MTIQTKDLISTFLMKGVIRYTTVFMGRLARRQALSSSWQFDCNCLRCQVNIFIHPFCHLSITYVSLIQLFWYFYFSNPPFTTATLTPWWEFSVVFYNNTNCQSIWGKNIMIWRWRRPINSFHCYNCLKSGIFAYIHCLLIFGDPTKAYWDDLIIKRWNWWVWWDGIYP